MATSWARREKAQLFKMKTAKPRIDAWDAKLTDEQRWHAYAKLRRTSWYEFAAWVNSEYGIAKPSRGAVYRWADRMRKMESTRRIEQAIQARAEIGALAGTSAANDKLIHAYKSMAAELALNGDAKEAVRLTQMAMQLAAQQTAQAELALKKERLEQQAEAQRLAREKFEAAEARATAAEKRAEVAEAKNKELQAQIKALETALQEAGKSNVADPAAVAAEVDKLLGRKS